MEKLGLKIPVECRTQACPEFGVRRRVPLFVVVEGKVGPDGTFQAPTLLAKCPSKFEAEGVAGA